ncbi:class I adenylate-forming enzyme family protein [Saccharothrix deserti]|uniref:class I adenylate-forming enzyme family protein n=1 Tax=Saccharothrix deserti TaxID=2593674 RepID=UPI00131C51CC|nr:fatty acid--CoA ligase family protein [Saccharothrix deserti]
MRILEAVRERAPRAEAIAIVTPSRARTFADLFDAVSSFAAELTRRHPPGEPVVALLTDPFATAVATLGCDAAGVPLVHRDPAVPGVPGEALLGQADNRPAGRQWQRLGVADLALAPRRAAEPPPVLPAGAQVFLTSGSTGSPVGVVRGADALLADADRVGRYLRYGVERPVLVAAPVFHVYGFAYGLLGPLLHGATARHHPTRCVPSQLARAALELEARTLIGLPIHYGLLARAISTADGAPEFAGVERAVSAGGPLGPGVAAAVARHTSFTLFNCYGSSEAGAVTLSPTTGDEPEGDIGEPLPGVAARTLYDGPEPQELLVRSDALAHGRIRMDEGGATVVPLPLQDGWYRTGDLARSATGRRIQLAGRADAVINVGGARVNPLEIETILASHPDVLDVHVRGESDSARGQVPVARVVLREGTRTGPLVLWCRQRLAPHLVPRRIDAVPSITRTATGKVAAVDGTHAPERGDHD